MDSEAIIGPSQTIPSLTPSCPDLASLLKKQEESNNVLHEIFLQLKRNWMAQEELSKDTRYLTSSLNKLRATIALSSNSEEATLSGSQSSSQESRESRFGITYLEMQFQDSYIAYSEWILTRKEMTTKEEDLSKLIESGLGCEEDLLKIHSPWTNWKEELY